ncbi:MAG: hypothetical protein U9Q63_03500 [Patescibacteria group bacterium]|nr:hypothetical protein [Patescibacteria group bacterium]
MKKVLSLFFVFVLLGTGCSKPAKLEESSELKPQIGGSCNRIEVEGEGYCSDYVGVKSNLTSPCSNQHYSSESCPPSNTGGCKLNPGTDKEKIVWSYDYGGYPVDEFQVKNELIPSCNNRGGQWTN